MDAEKKQALRNALLSGARIEAGEDSPRPEKNLTAPNFLLSDPLLTDTDVARITGRARKTLQKDRLRGGDESIPFIRLGRLVRYRLSDVQRFIAQRPVLRSTSQAGEA